MTLDNIPNSRASNRQLPFPSHLSSYLFFHDCSVLSQFMGYLYSLIFCLIHFGFSLFFKDPNHSHTDLQDWYLGQPSYLGLDCLADVIGLTMSTLFTKDIPVSERLEKGSMFSFSWFKNFFGQGEFHPTDILNNFLLTLILLWKDESSWEYLPSNSWKEIINHSR